MVSMSSNSNQQQLKKKTKGKQKVEIKKIEKKESRHVTFTKRRKGLFKKCYELCSTYDSQFAAIAFSIAGKPFVSGYPSADQVIQCFVSDSSNANWGNQNDVASTSSGVTGCRLNWWDNPINDLGLKDLQRFKTALEGLRDEVLSKANQISRSNAVENTDNQSSDYYQLMENNALTEIPKQGLMPPDVCLRDGIVSRVDQYSRSIDWDTINCECINEASGDLFPNYCQWVENTAPIIYSEFKGFAF